MSAHKATDIFVQINSELIAKFEPVDDEFAKLLVCPICLGIMVDPVITKCSHHFCKSCISSVQNCPLCRKAISLIISDKTICQIRDYISIKCLQEDKDGNKCCQIIKYGDINYHFKNECDSWKMCIYGCCSTADTICYGEWINTLQVGDFIDAVDTYGKWYESIVAKIKNDVITVHYRGYPGPWVYNRTQAISSIRPAYTHVHNWRNDLKSGDIIEYSSSSERWYRGIITHMNPNGNICLDNEVIVSRISNVSIIFLFVLLIINYLVHRLHWNAFNIIFQNKDI